MKIQTSKFTGRDRKGNNEYENKTYLSENDIPVIEQACVADPKITQVMVIGTDVSETVADLKEFAELFSAKLQFKGEIIDGKFDESGDVFVKLYRNIQVTPPTVKAWASKLQ